MGEQDKPDDDNEKPLAQEHPDPLSTAYAEANKPIFHCLPDFFTAPQLEQFKHERLPYVFWGDQKKQIEEEFHTLSEEVNLVLKKEYQMPDRRSLAQRKFVFSVFYTIYVIIVAIIGIIMLNRIGNVMSVQGDVTLQYLIPNFVLMVVLAVAMLGCYKFCLDGSDVVGMLDERLIEKAKPTLDLWNNAHQEISAELTMLDEKKETGKIERVLPTLKLWKKEDL